MGFENVPIPKFRSGPADREFIVTHPFGLLRRKESQGLEQIEIQLGPRGDAAFGIDFGTIPDSGIEGALGHIEPDQALVTWLEESFGLYERPRSFGLFSVHRWWWSKRERT